MPKLSKSTYEEFAKSHRTLWRWCGETGKDKNEYPGWFGDLNKYPRYTVKRVPSYKHAHILHDCFACGIANMNWYYANKDVCGEYFCSTRCPVVDFRVYGSGMSGKCGNTVSGLFYKYKEAKVAKNTKMHKKYALEIAELPWFEYEIYMKYLGVKLYDFDLVEIKNAYGSLEFKF